MHFLLRFTILQWNFDYLYIFPKTFFLKFGLEPQVTDDGAWKKLNHFWMDGWYVLTMARALPCILINFIGFISPLGTHAPRIFTTLEDIRLPWLWNELRKTPQVFLGNICQRRGIYFMTEYLLVVVDVLENTYLSRNVTYSCS